MESVARGVALFLLVPLLAADLLLVATAPVTTAPSSAPTTSKPAVAIHTFKNQQCRLHYTGETRTCGMRALDQTDDQSVLFWKPSLCIKLGCQCLATKEIRRERRSIVNNRTETETKRFRIFECI